MITMVADTATALGRPSRPKGARGPTMQKARNACYWIPSFLSRTALNMFHQMWNPKRQQSAEFLM